MSSKLVVKQCAICEVEFERKYPSRAKTCSEICHSQLISKINRDTLDQRLKKRFGESYKRQCSKQCPICLKTFYTTSLWVEKRKTCSKECMGIYQTITKRMQGKKRTIFTPTIRKRLHEKGVWACGKCLKVLPIDAFTKDVSSAHGLSNICRECGVSYRQGENYERQVERYNHSDYYKQNVVVKYRATGAHRRNNQKYQTTEKGHATSRAAQRKRRAQKKAVGEHYTTIDEQITFAIFGKQCFICGSINDLTMDHYYCLNDGHPLTITNAVPLCGICNSSKGTRLPQDFYTALQMQQIQQKFIEAEKLKESKFENKEERNNE